jgi:GTP-binding protein EngB required for normal cell division
MAAFMLKHDRPVLLVATKADLVPKNRRLSQQRRLEKSFGVPAGWSVMCSSKTKEGEGELWQRIHELYS